MKLGFVYAGQGSQHEGMGKDLYEHEEIFRQTFDLIDPTHTWRDLCFSGSAEELEDTRNTQPCMVSFAIATTAVLKARGIHPSYLCGLSLGEYSSLAAAGVFDPADAVKLAAYRGQAMADAAKGIDSLMVAILGLDAEAVRTACKNARTRGIVEVANYNCPGQIVISGEKAAVSYASDLAKESGAKRCIPLAVSGPFHTSLMKPAAEALHTRFLETTFHPMEVPVIFNATARPLEEGKTVAQMLELQVQTSIHFDDSVRYMADCGVDTIVEIGPGKALSKLVKKTVRDMRVFQVEDCVSLEATITALEEMD